MAFPRNGLLLLLLLLLFEFEPPLLFEFPLLGFEFVFEPPVATAVAVGKALLLFVGAPAPGAVVAPAGGLAASVESSPPARVATPPGFVAPLTRSTQIPFPLLSLSHALPGPKKS